MKKYTKNLIYFVGLDEQLTRLLIISVWFSLLAQDLQACESSQKESPALRWTDTPQDHIRLSLLLTRLNSQAAPFELQHLMWFRLTVALKIAINCSNTLREGGRGQQSHCDISSGRGFKWTAWFYSPLQRSHSTFYSLLTKSEFVLDALNLLLFVFHKTDVVIGDSWQRRMMSQRAI